MLCANAVAGAADYAIIDQAANFRSSIFKDKAVEWGAVVRIALVEIHEGSDAFERSNTHFWTEKNKLCAKSLLISEADCFLYPRSSAWRTKL